MASLVCFCAHVVYTRVHACLVPKAWKSTTHQHCVVSVCRVKGATAATNSFHLENWKLEWKCHCNLNKKENNGCSKSCSFAGKKKRNHSLLASSVTLENDHWFRGKLEMILKLLLPLICQFFFGFDANLQAQCTAKPGKLLSEKKRRRLLPEMQNHKNHAPMHNLMTSANISHQSFTGPPGWVFSIRCCQAKGPVGKSYKGWK